MARGDHIRTPRARGTYYHHGIDIGGDEVVHFSGEPMRWNDAIVCRVPMAEFAQGAAVEVVDDGSDTRDADAVVAVALEMVGQRGYNLVFNNCEHFATYCRTGRHASRQVRRVLRAAAATGSVLIAAGSVLLLSVRRNRTA